MRYSATMDLPSPPQPEWAWWLGSDEGDRKVFGGSGITRECYDRILELVPRGGLLFELGSGAVSTRYLSEHCRVIAVEHDVRFLGAHPVDYVYAPIAEDGWYAVAPIRRALGELRARGERYDLLLVDGPTGSESRGGLLRHLDIFDLFAPVVVDDADRSSERQIVEDLARRTGRAPDWRGHFAVV